MSRVVAFSRFLAYDVGGAERSTMALLCERAKLGDEITVFSVADGCFLGHRLDPLPIPDGARHELLDGLTQIGRFSYVEYLLNRHRLMRRFANMEADELWTYGIWAPAAALTFPGKVRYFVRSETDLGIVGNYYSGFRRLLKIIYSSLERPAIDAYRLDLRRVADRAEFIANSRYMASRVRAVLGVEADVIYPRVDVEPIRTALAGSSDEKRWVVFVGDNVYKGLQIVLAAAKALPNLSFRIVSRLADTERVVGNITWMPWQSKTWKIYAGARLVIVPSQWGEAYGRTAREAVLLNIPVLVSKVGGLPEAVDDHPSRLVTDYRNPKVWTEAIEAAVTLSWRDQAPSQKLMRLDA